MKKYSIFIFQLLLIFIILQVNSEVLISLPDNYNYFRPPKNESGDPLNVTFSWKIRHSRIANVDMSKQTIQIYMSFKLIWIDERLNITEVGSNEKQVRFFNYFITMHSILISTSDGLGT